MTALLLDTTFLIDVERGDGPDGLFADTDDIAIAAVTIAELRLGVELARGKRRVARRAFVDDVVATVPVLPYTVDVAAEHAQLLAEVRRAGRPRGAHDLIIAATARWAKRTVVTADPSGFEELTGVRVLPHR